MSILSKFELSLFDFIYSIDILSDSKNYVRKTFSKVYKPTQKSNFKKTREKLKNHKRSKKFKKKIKIMKLNIIAALISGSSAAVHTIHNCPETLEIRGHPTFELQLDGSYRNHLDATVTQNPEDGAWFIMGLENDDVIVSFDQAECPTENKKWFSLDLSEMKYTETKLSFQ